MELEEKILMQCINLNVLSNMFMEYVEELVPENIEEALKNYKQYTDNYIVNLTDKKALECSFIIQALLEGTLQLYLYSTNNTNIDQNKLIELYEKTEPKENIDKKAQKKYLVELKQSIYNDTKKEIYTKEETTILDKMKKINNNKTNIFKTENSIENVTELTEEFLLILDELTQKLEKIKESNRKTTKNLTNF